MGDVPQLYAPVGNRAILPFLQIGTRNGIPEIMVLGKQTQTVGYCNAGIRLHSWVTQKLEGMDKIVHEELEP